MSHIFDESKNYKLVIVIARDTSSAHSPEKGSQVAIKHLGIEDSDYTRDMEEERDKVL